MMLTWSWCCRNYTLRQMVQSLVLPLAGDNNSPLCKWRHGGHAELGMIADALRIQVTIHDVETKVFKQSVGPEESFIKMSLLSTGDHIELVFE